MDDDDRIELYDYMLPEQLIARVPAERRDASRLMVVDRERETIDHRQFAELPELLQPGDLLVINDTRVVPARLIGFRTATGGKWEGLFLREEARGRWRIIGQTRGKLTPGETLTLLPAAPHGERGGIGPPIMSSMSSGDISAPDGSAMSPLERERPPLPLVLQEKTDDGEWIVRPESDESTWQLLAHYGTMPLPPYLEREAVGMDWERYQTVYATAPGAVAAPTAGLHFTPQILDRCREREIETAPVTLHVGLGTFRPVSVERLSEHHMHHEWCELPAETVAWMERARSAGGRVVAVGTTTVRTLEAAARRGPLEPWRGETNLFIRPPFQFRSVDAILTNFHLPKSTLLVLVSTFAGRNLILHAYREAVRENYRFFSYGDAMLIL